MKITNKKRFIISNLILLSIIFMLIYMSKGTLSTSIVSYTETYVEEGDTLWQNEKRQQNNNEYYKDKEIREIVSNLKKVNNLKTSNLSVGQKIIIPTI